MSSSLHGDVHNDETMQDDMRRVDSGETMDSPFGSNLATPEDEEFVHIPGIHQRLGSKNANEVFDYFRTKQKHAIVVTDIHPAFEGVPERTGPEIGRATNAEAELECLPFPASASVEERSAISQEASPAMSSGTDDSQLGQPKANSIFTLPNEHINIDSMHSNSSNKRKQNLPEMQDFSPTDILDRLASHPPSYRITEALYLARFLPFLAVQVAFFLPWCIAVGGAILLFPHKLEGITFGTGYIASPKGIHRFAHWADCGMQHVLIFLTFLGLLVGYFPTLGCLIVGGLVAQFMSAWRNFAVDYDAGLGEDDRQTIYVLAKQCWLSTSDGVMDIRKAEAHDGFLISPHAQIQAPDGLADD